MLQNVNGEILYVVDFDTMPALPITGNGKLEQAYADALTQAIETGIVQEPGKYGIRLHYFENRWDICKIIE